MYLHQRIGGRIKAFLPIYDFSYEMTTLLSPDERTAMRQASLPNERPDPRAGEIYPNRACRLT